MNQLIKFFIDRPKIVHLFSILMVVAGVLAATGLRRQTYPDVSLEQLQIQTIYPAASAHDVEVNVTIPLEEKIIEVDGLDEVRSFSMENFSFIQVKVDPDAKDKEQVKNDVRRAVDQITDLPEAVKERPYIYESVTSWMPIGLLALSGEGLSEEEMRQIAERMEKEIEALPGIGHVDKMGYRDREIQVQLDPEKLSQYYLSLQEVVRSIQNKNIRLTGGSFESYKNQAAVLILGEFTDANEIKDVIVRSNFNGERITIKDIGQVIDGYEKRTFELRANGIVAIGLRLHKKETADAMTTMAGVEKYLQEIRPQLPKTLKIQKLREFTKITERRLDILRNNALLGLVLVMAVLIMFLNLRVALWTGIGIPIAMGIGIVAHAITGGTMDSISLTAFILVLGMLVDDAIVVAENIHRHQEEGMAPVKAALTAVAEVAAPITAAVATSVIAFLPMLALGGMLGAFVKMIPIIIAGTLIGSLVESFFILPSHLSGHKVKLNKGKEKGALIDPVFKPFRKLYQRALSLILQKRYLALTIGLTAFLGFSYLAVSNMKFVLFPQEVAENFFIHVEAEKGASLQATREIVKKVEAIIAVLPREELENYETNLGADYSQGGREIFANHLAYIRVKLTPYGKRKRQAVEIMEDIRKKSRTMTNGNTLIFELDAGGPPVGRPVELNLLGKDVYKNKEVAEGILIYLQGIPGVIDPSMDLKYSREEYVIQLDDKELSRRGLTVKDVANTIRIAYEGLEVSSVRMGQENVDIRVQYNEANRKQVDSLKNIKVINPYGKMVPLAELMKVSKRLTIQSINHYQGQQVITISADVDTKIITSNEVLEKVKKNYANFVQEYPGIRLVITGEGKESAKTVNNMIRAGILAVLVIYFVLVLLLNSLVQPFIILITIPFGVGGVLLAFWMQNMAMGFLAMIGMLGMIGVVVNDSLIILTFINHLAKSNKQTMAISHNIILEAAQIRLRPVILTTLTTVAGLLPTAYGFGGSDPFIVPMVMAMLWGLIFATTLTLLWIPMMVAIGQDIKHLRR